MELIGNDPT